MREIKTAVVQVKEFVCKGLVLKIHFLGFWNHWDSLGTNKITDFSPNKFSTSFNPLIVILLEEIKPAISETRETENRNRSLGISILEKLDNHYFVIWAIFNYIQLWKSARKR